MKNSNTYHYSIAIIFIWVGFICAISFMEAWLKFQAPGITTELGLGIGQLVFGMLNKVEIACAISITLGAMLSNSVKAKNGIGYLFVVLIALGIESIWLLPALDQRASLIIKGVVLPKSKLHLGYVLLEIAKTICLIVYGMKLLTRVKK